MKVVVDTNIFLSALIRPRGYTAQVLQACRDDVVQLVMPKPQLVELGRILHERKIQKYLRWDDETISRYLHELSTFAEIVPGTTPVEVTDDPTDDVLFAAALEARAKIIISGDAKHVLKVGSYRGIQTMNPKTFVERFLALA